MGEETTFAFEVVHLEGYAFQVRFDWDTVPDLVLDEPRPLGEERGPNAARLVAAAAANCLSASLLYCMTKREPVSGGIRAEVRGHMVRNEQGRLRIGGLSVTLHLSPELAARPKLGRCSELFEDFCVVTASLRRGFPVRVRVNDPQGRVLHESE
ncbi:MAG TPA: OsmC family peroxiredoxin [Chromatiales bacterium]|nr:OsmC family peroxiredoxin [Chromatiales bacterium]